MHIERMTRDEAQLITDASDLFDYRPDYDSTLRYLSDPSNVFFLAFDDSAIAGFLRGTSLLQIKNKLRQMLLYEIGVAEGHRRKGIGRALINELIAFCRSRGFQEIFVLTSPTNTAAVNLYRATGAVTETDSDRMYIYHLQD